MESLVRIEIDGEVLEVTEEHPFWVIGEGWVAAEDLREGDRITSLTGSGTVLGLGATQEITVVYNLEIAKLHSFFVSEGKLLVHNSCKVNPPQAQPEQLEFEFVKGDLSGKLPEAVMVTKWGKKGLESGDWVMPGGKTLLNYIKSGKWDPFPWNKPAPFSSGESFAVWKDSVKLPQSEGLLGKLKGLLLNQKQYIPGK